MTDLPPVIVTKHIEFRVPRRVKLLKYTALTIDAFSLALVIAALAVTFGWDSGVSVLNAWRGAVVATIFSVAFSRGSFWVAKRIMRKALHRQLTNLIYAEVMDSLATTDPAKHQALTDAINGECTNTENDHA